MRPEITAFRELEVLVRNLGEQLAGYRKRALTAEGKCRELEGTLADARREQERLSAALAASRRSQDELTRKLETQPVPAVSPQSVEPAMASVYDTADEALRHENHELRVRLEEARERTVQVVDRVRFLRQQLTVEK